MGTKQSSPPKAKKPCGSGKKKDNQNKDKCNYKELSVSDGSRTYLSNKNKEKKFEIVCGNSGTFRKITVKLNGIQGPPPVSQNKCLHDKKTFDIDFSSDSKTNDSLTFTAKSEYDTSLEGVLKNIQMAIWPPFAPGKDFSIRSNTCGKQNSLELIALPNLDSSLSLKTKTNGGIEFVLLGEDTSKNDDILRDILDWKIGKYFEGSFSSKYDGKEYIKLTLGNKDDEEKFTKIPSIDTIKYLVKGLLECRDTLKTVLSKGKGEVKITIGPQFSIACKMQERKEDLLSEYEAIITIGFDPLIKLTASYDFMGPLLGSIPGIGPALAGIKWLVEKYNAGELSLKLILEGGVSYTGKMTKNPGKDWVSDLEPKGSIELKIEFVAAYDITISYYIGAYHKSGKFKAAGKGGIKIEPAEDKTKRYRISDNSIDIQLETKFTGVTVYWIKGTTTGNVITVPNGIPKSFGAETTSMADDDDLKNVPKDQQWEMFPEKTLTTGYYNLVSR